MRRALTCAVLLSSLAACGDGAETLPLSGPSGAPPARSESSATTDVLEPVTFTRGKGAPTTETRTFSVDGFSGPFTLHVRNGAPDGKHRVSSAVIEVNGEAVFTPKDFDQKVERLAREVELEGENALSVRLASAPGSYLTVWSEGQRDEGGPEHFCPGVAGAHQDLQEAINAAGDGGAVIVCHGVHDVRPATITDPVTVTGLEGGEAVLRTEEGYILTVDGARDVLIQDLGFRGGLAGVFATNGADVIVTASRFEDHAGAGAGAISVARFVVDNSVFVAGLPTAVFVEDADEVHVNENLIGATIDNGIHVDRSAGIVVRNRISGCGRHCIFVKGGPGDLVVAANEMTLVPADENFISVVAHWYAGSGMLSIEGNRIDGGEPDPANPGAYTITATGIQVEGLHLQVDDLPLDTPPGAPVRVVDNYVRNANVGIAAGYSGVIVGHDNVVDVAGVALQTWQRGRLSLRASDLTRYGAALGQGNMEEPDEWIVAECNWWGTPDGPQGVWGVGPDQYTPWATAPVARNAGGPCDGGI